MEKLVLLVLSLFFGVYLCAAQQAQLMDYPLPDPLETLEGNRVSSISQWEEEQRPQLLAQVQKLMYGHSPEVPKNLKFVVFEQDSLALNGTAIRKQVAIYLENDQHLLDLLIYLPRASKKPVPVFLGLNFEGNHTIHKDPTIRLSAEWVWIGAAGSLKNHATEHSRGTQSSRWPVELILANGFGVATVYAGDLDPDYHDEFKNGIHRLYPELQERGDNFSTMGAWAWGLSRCMDYFETDSGINAKQIAVIGFSRMGKAAIWAGAKDQRFAMVVSNESGGGGAALSKRMVGETIARLNNGNPHWFCENFKKFNANEIALPFDQHTVLSLIAPRLVYVGSAVEDLGADPLGEFLGLKYTSDVFALYGKEGLLDQKFPKINQPITTEVMGYHIRSGNHDITEFDWQQYLNFARENLK